MFDLCKHILWWYINIGEPQQDFGYFIEKSTVIKVLIVARMHLSRIVILSDVNLLRIILWRCENFVTVPKVIFRFKNCCYRSRVHTSSKRFRSITGFGKFRSYRHELSPFQNYDVWKRDRAPCTTNNNQEVLRWEGLVLVKLPQTAMREQPLASEPRPVTFASLSIHRKDKRKTFYHYLMIFLESLRN